MPRRSSERPLPARLTEGRDRSRDLYDRVRPKNVYSKRTGPRRIGSPGPPTPSRAEAGERVADIVQVQHLDVGDLAAHDVDDDLAGPAVSQLDLPAAHEPALERLPE